MVYDSIHTLRDKIFIKVLITVIKKSFPLASGDDL